jgi:hypothetical protein
MTVGGKTKLDKSISRDFNNDFLQYSSKKIFDRDNYYVTVIEDYIIEVFLDEKISREINQLLNKLPTTKDGIFFGEVWLKKTQKTIKFLYYTLNSII